MSASGSSKAGDASSRYEKQAEELREAAKAIAPTKPIAYSINGLSFTYEAPLSLSLPIGSYVEIVAGNTRYLGQITSQEVLVRTGPEYGIKLDTESANIWLVKATASSQFLDRVRVSFLSGEGTILGRLDGKPIQGIRNVSEQDTFQDGSIEKATEQAIETYLESAVAGQSALDIGASIYGGNTGRIRLRAAVSIAIHSCAVSPDLERPLLSA